MNSMAVKIMSSGLVLAVTTVGCQMDGFALRPGSLAFAQDRADADAASLARQAAQAMQRGDAAAAIAAMEQAVSRSPRDAGYRLTLADLYMRAGRFQSAEATYRDVLSIDPGRSRAGISLALMLSANGRQQQALSVLEQLEGASPADLGLAYALAGAPQRGIAILEPAARSAGATGRIRQNLALAHALAGDWQQARTIAAQDVSPGELSQRMAQWASLANGGRAADQVAALLGVSPVADPGQPVQLALAAPSAPVRTAEAAPAAPGPVEVAAADIPQPIPAPLPGGEAAPAPVAAPAPSAPAQDNDLEQPEWGLDERGNVELPAPPAESEQLPVRVQYAAATDALVRADPAVMRTTPRAARRSVASGWRQVAQALPAPRRERATGATDGRFVVQIGAFSSAANAERAWQRAESRFGLTSRAPVTMTFDMNGRMLHRVAIGGFDSRGEAGALCQSIRSRGGECFVRSSAGDAPIRWAARYSRRG